VELWIFSVQRSCMAMGGGSPQVHPGRGGSRSPTPDLRLLDCPLYVGRNAASVITRPSAAVSTAIAR
jgi:hypothetical protein